MRKKDNIESTTKPINPDKIQKAFSKAEEFAVKLHSKLVKGTEYIGYTRDVLNATGKA